MNQSHNEPCARTADLDELKASVFTVSFAAILLRRMTSCRASQCGGVDFINTAIPMNLQHCCLPLKSRGLKKWNSNQIQARARRKSTHFRAIKKHSDSEYILLLSSILIEKEECLNLH